MSSHPGGRLWLLLFGGPAILSSLNERWRVFWLLGQRSTPLEGDDAGQFWVFLSIVYFLVVVGGAVTCSGATAVLTSVYNVEPRMVEDALIQAGENLGINATRSGNLFVFGISLGSSLETWDQPSAGLPTPPFFPPRPSLLWRTTPRRWRSPRARASSR